MGFERLNKAPYGFREMEDSSPMGFERWKIAPYGLQEREDSRWRKLLSVLRDGGQLPMGFERWRTAP